MKKIIKGAVLVLIFGFLSVASVNASASFNDNGAPGDPDLPTVQVRNRTTEGSCVTCTFHNSVTANPGDILTVQIYYHNTSKTETANNAHVQLAQPTGSSKYFTLSGSVSASNASTSFGSATVSITGSQNQTLTYVPNTLLWYAEKPLINKGLLGTESNLFNFGGLSIGNVSSWNTCPVTGGPTHFYQDTFCHRGFVTLQFKVSSNANPVIDVCDNISGVQPTVPNGYYQSGNDCFPTQQQIACSIDNFYADDTNIDYGDSTMLRWNTSNCSNVSISSIGNVSLNSNYTTGTLYNDKTFILTAYGNYGSTQTATETVYVNDQNNDNCTIDDFYASDTSISYGDSTKLYWETTDCDYVTISGIGSHLDANDNEDTPDLYDDKTYTIKAYGDNSDDTDSVKIYVSSQPQPQTYACNDGYDNDHDGKIDMGDIGCSSYYDDDEYNYVLPPPPPPPVVQTHYIYTNNTTQTAVAVGEQLVELTIDSRYENVNAGDIIDYTVTYKNKTNNQTISDAMIQVLFPENVEFMKSQQGEYSIKDNTLTIMLGTLSPNEFGMIYMSGKVKQTAKTGDLLTTAATMAFKNKGNSSFTVIAYETNNVVHGGNGSLLGALALFGADGIMPTTLGGWLLLILIVMLLVYLGRKLFGKDSNPQVIHTPYTAPARPYTPPAQTYSEHQPIATPPHDLPH